MPKLAIISQPTQGKTQEKLESELSGAKAHLESRGFTKIVTVQRNGPAPTPLKELAKTIEQIADADVVLFLDGWELVKACRIERLCCDEYGIPTVTSRFLKLYGVTP
jgi:hypothetical protein